MTIEYSQHIHFAGLRLDSTTPPKPKSPPSFPTSPKRKEDYIKTPAGKTNYPKKHPPSQPTLWPKTT